MFVDLEYKVINFGTQRKSYEKMGRDFVDKILKDNIANVRGLVERIIIVKLL